jgi:hypothetical protein
VAGADHHQERVRQRRDGMGRIRCPQDTPNGNAACEHRGGAEQKPCTFLVSIASALPASSPRTTSHHDGWAPSQRFTITPSATDQTLKLLDDCP